MSGVALIRLYERASGRLLRLRVRQFVGADHLLVLFPVVESLGAVFGRDWPFRGIGNQETGYVVGVGLWLPLSVLVGAAALLVSVLRIGRLCSALLCCLAGPLLGLFSAADGGLTLSDVAVLLQRVDSDICRGIVIA